MEYFCCGTCTLSQSSERSAKIFYNQDQVSQGQLKFIDQQKAPLSLRFCSSCRQELKSSNNLNPHTLLKNNKNPNSNLDQNQKDTLLHNLLTKDLKSLQKPLYVLDLPQLMNQGVTYVRVNEAISNQIVPKESKCDTQSSWVPNENKTELSNPTSIQPRGHLDNRGLFSPSSELMDDLNSPQNLSDQKLAVNNEIIAVNNFSTVSEIAEELSDISECQTVKIRRSVEHTPPPTSPPITDTQKSSSAVNNSSSQNVKNPTFLAYESDHKDSKSKHNNNQHYHSKSDSSGRFNLNSRSATGLFEQAHLDPSLITILGPNIFPLSSSKSSNNKQQLANNFKNDSDAPSQTENTFQILKQTDSPNISNSNTSTLFYGQTANNTTAAPFHQNRESFTNTQFTAQTLPAAVSQSYLPNTAAAEIKGAEANDHLISFGASVGDKDAKKQLPSLRQCHTNETLPDVGQFQQEQKREGPFKYETTMSRPSERGCGTPSPNMSQNRKIIKLKTLQTDCSPSEILSRVSQVHNLNLTCHSSQLLQIPSKMEHISLPPKREALCVYLHEDYFREQQTFQQQAFINLSDLMKKQMQKSAQTNAQTLPEQFSASQELERPRLNPPIPVDPQSQPHFTEQTQQSLSKQLMVTGELENSSQIQTKQRDFGEVFKDQSPINEQSYEQIFSPKIIETGSSLVDLERTNLTIKPQPQPYLASTSDSQSPVAQVSAKDITMQSITPKKQLLILPERDQTLTLVENNDLKTAITKNTDRVSQNNLNQPKPNSRSSSSLFKKNKNNKIEMCNKSTELLQAEKRTEHYRQSLKLLQTAVEGRTQNHRKPSEISNQNQSQKEVQKRQNIHRSIPLQILDTKIESDVCKVQDLIALYKSQTSQEALKSVDTRQANSVQNERKCKTPFADQTQELLNDPTFVVPSGIEKHIQISNDYECSTSKQPTTKKAPRRNNTERRKQSRKFASLRSEGRLTLETGGTRGVRESQAISKGFHSAMKANHDYLCASSDNSSKQGRRSRDERIRMRQQSGKQSPFDVYNMQNVTLLR